MVYYRRASRVWKITAGGACAAMTERFVHPGHQEDTPDYPSAGQRQQMKNEEGTISPRVQDVSHLQQNSRLTTAQPQAQIDQKDVGLTFPTAERLNKLSMKRKFRLKRCRTVDVEKVERLRSVCQHLPNQRHVARHRGEDLIGRTIASIVTFKTKVMEFGQSVSHGNNSCIELRTLGTKFRAVDFIASRDTARDLFSKDVSVLRL